MAGSFDALGAPDEESVRVKIRVHPAGEHYVRVPRAVRGEGVKTAGGMWLF